jgi:hypothetical protein
MSWTFEDHIRDEPLAITRHVIFRNFDDGMWTIYGRGLYVDNFDKRVKYHTLKKWSFCKLKMEDKVVLIFEVFIQTL